MAHKAPREKVAEKSMFCCPLCGGALAPNAQGTALCCAKKHSFDLAREGYVHLLPASRMHAKMPGDSREMVAARSRFLQAGFYAPFSDALNEIVRAELCPAANAKQNGPLCSDQQNVQPPSAALKTAREQRLAGHTAARVRPADAPLIVDAGCGEGYYTNRLAASLGAEDARIAAFDISKFAVKAAAKQAAAQAVAAPAGQIAAPAAVEYAVAGSFGIPLPCACAQIIVNVFSPMAREEFLRVLKPGGLLIFAVPGPRHLYGLKQILYDTPYDNAVQDVAYAGFVCERRCPVRASIRVPAKAVQDLFAMTPYYWKTPKEGAQRLAACAELTSEIEFDFVCYRKQ
ncbi:MAG: methyltransferase domain-containing protein [Ruthenibacterium sp.]